MTDLEHNISLPRRVAEIVFALLLLGLAWQLCVCLKLLDPTFFGSPIRIMHDLHKYRSTLTDDLLFTSRWLLVGLLFTIAVAFISAVLIHLSPGTISRPTYAIVVMFQTVPVFILAPVIAFAAGFGATARLIIVAIVAFFPALVSTLDGLRATDRERRDVFESMNANALQRLYLLELPQAIYMLMSGLKVTLTMVAIGTVIAEMTIGVSGDGLSPAEEPL